MSDDTFTSNVGGGVDPIDEEAPVVNVLEELRMELAEEVRNDNIIFKVPKRPNIEIEASPNVTQPQIRQWRNNSGANSATKPMDSVRFGCYVINETLVGIYVNGHLVENDNGIALNFASQEIQDMVNASTPFEAIQLMFGVDPHIEAAAMGILEKAGYGDEIELEDPTTRS